MAYCSQWQTYQCVCMCNCEMWIFLAIVLWFGAFEIGNYMRAHIPTCVSVQLCRYFYIRRFAEFSYSANQFFCYWIFSAFQRKRRKKKTFQKCEWNVFAMVSICLAQKNAYRTTYMHTQTLSFNYLKTNDFEFLLALNASHLSFCHL